MNKFLVITLLVSLLVACNEKENKEAEPVAKAQVEEVTSTVLKVGSENTDTKQSNGDKMTGNPQVKIETNLGDIVVELDQKNAPISTENFLAYVESGYYDNTIFHRVIPNFMIQGGGFSSDLAQKEPRGSIQNEADNGLSNKRGTISMARTNEPHSASAQFFINVKDNAFLDHRSKNMQGWGYAVFGKVISGMEVIDKIESVQTETKVIGKKAGDMPHENVPVELVIMKKVSLIK